MSACLFFMLIFFCFLAHLFQLLGGELQLKQHLWQEQVKLNGVYSFGFQFSNYMKFTILDFSTSSILGPLPNILTDPFLCLKLFDMMYNPGFQ